jgi:beta-N-acetylhexosaminidase
LLGAGPAPADIAQAGSAEHRALSRLVAAQSITLLRNDSGLLPLPAGASLLVVEAPEAAGLGRALGATTISVSANPTDTERAMVMQLAGDGRTVVVGTSDAASNPNQAKLVKALLEARAPTIVVAMRGPYDLMAFPEASTYLVTYGGNPPAMEALVNLLLGKAAPQGKLPVDLPGLYSRGAGLTGFTPGP